MKKTDFLQVLSLDMLKDSHKKLQPNLFFHILLLCSFSLYFMASDWPGILTSAIILACVAFVTPTPDEKKMLGSFMPESGGTASLQLFTHMSCHHTFKWLPAIKVGFSP